MEYISNGKNVVQLLGENNAPHFIAACLNEKWAEHVAKLLQKDYDND